MYLPLSRHEYFHPIGRKTSNIEPYYGFLSLTISLSAHSRQKRARRSAHDAFGSCVSKALPQTGNTVPYYLSDYGDTENINLNICT